MKATGGGAWLAALLALAVALPAGAATDELRIQELRQDIRELQRMVREQSRRIDELERQLARGAPAGAGVRPRGAPPRPPDTDWVAPERWSRLREGMSAQEVIAILGPPTSMRGEEPGVRTLFYTLQIGDSGFLSGTVQLENDRVRQIARPELK